MGLARLSSDGNAVTQAELTGTGAVLGTIDYMAPEQADDTKHADARADIYALGCTLYRLLTSHVPYKGETLIQILMAHRESPIPSICKDRPDVPPQLDAVFKKMVAKKPEERYQTMTEVMTALNACVDKRSAKAASVAEDATAAFPAEDNLAFLRGTSPRSMGTAVKKQVERPAAANVSRRSAIEETSKHLGRGTKLLVVSRKTKLPFVGIGLGVLGVIAVIALTLIVRIRRPDRTEQESRFPDGTEAIASKPALPRTTRAVPGKEQRVRVPSSFIGPDGKWRLPPGAPLPAIAPFDARKATEHQEAWAKYLGMPVEIINSIGMKLLLIPPGEFEMGSLQQVTGDELKTAPKDDGWYLKRLSGEGPRHHVRITRPFYLGMYLVTQEEYEKVTGTSPSEFSATGKFEDRIAGQDTKRLPVDNVSWQDTREFCSRLSEMAEEKLAGRRYRLPSEAQWEYACRAGTTGRRFFSPALSVRTASGEDQLEESQLFEYAWFLGNSGMRTHAVGGRRASAWGLCDMYGNVWQWCQDWYDEGYYANSKIDNPAGPTEGSLRVMRGGSCFNNSWYCRSAYRFGQAPAFRYGDLGFRVSLVPAE
jgi:formylglycine-generating enzyme required for sulfatase activity